jgi:uncharacterized delta-60 repeat protein
MVLNHWRRLSSRLSSSPRACRRRFRPGLEPLEGRTLLNAGSLDPTFSGDGKINSGSSLPQEATAVAVQPDGKIVVVGWTENGAGDKDFRVVRYNTDGSLDNGKAGLDSTPGDKFGSAGFVDIGFNFGGTFNDMAKAVAIQADGKIVVAGWAAIANNDIDFAVARLNSDGSLDDGSVNNDGTPGDAFGTGGKTHLGFDIVGSTKGDNARALALQADGKIVVAGEANDNGGGSLFAVTRFNSNGSLDDGGLLDTTPGDAFDTDGMQTIGLGGLFDGAEAVALQADGKIVLAGYSQLSATNTDFAVARLNRDGSLDNGLNLDSTPGAAFSTNGRIRVPFNLDQGIGIDMAGTFSRSNPWRGQLLTELLRRQSE